MIKVIIPIDELPDVGGSRESLLNDYAVDFSDVLEFALLSWTPSRTAEYDLLTSALENPLDRHLYRKGFRRLNFLEFAAAVRHLVDAVAIFHERLSNTLMPVVDCLFPSHEVELTLIKNMERSIVIKMQRKDLAHSDSST